MSIQTNAKYYRNTAKMVKQALHLNSLGENMQIKMPACEAGIAAMEEVTYQGVSINATVSFTVAQAVCVAEAVERGLERRKAEGLPVDHMAPICTIMIGRTDDWMKEYIKKTGMVVEPEALEWAGVAVMKEAYRIFRERGYTTRLLTAANRNQYHWSEFIGGDIIMTIPAKWQKRFANCDVEIRDYMSEAVAADKLKQLIKLTPFVQAYTQGSLTEDDFNSFGPVILTIRYFTEEYEKAVHKVRDILLPNPIR